MIIVWTYWNKAQLQTALGVGEVANWSYTAPSAAGIVGPLVWGRLVTRGILQGRLVG